MAKAQGQGSEGQTTTKKLRPTGSGVTLKVAEEILEALEKKAKGGVLRRRRWL
jgi:hypothetical protein